MSLHGIQTINGLKVHFPDPSTAGQEEVQKEITTINDGYFKNYDKSTPMLSKGQLEGKWESSDYTIRGNLETVSRNYRNISNRTYYADSSVSAFKASAYSLVALPACLFRTATNWSHFRQEASNLAFCVKALVGGAVCGVVQGVSSLFLDSSIKASLAKAQEEKKEGNAAVLVIDVQYDFIGYRSLKAENEGDATDEANELLAKYGITIKDLGLTVSQSQVPGAKNFELNGDFVEMNGELYVYPRGSLAVASAARILPVVNAILAREEQGLVKVASQDFHPLKHGSFGPVLGAPLFTQVKLFGRDQTAWPIHCVQGSKGTDFAHGLNMDKIQKVFQKGLDILVDSYSAFFDNGKLNKTLLDEHLQSKNVKRVYVVGIATDYCVQYTARHAKELGYEVTLVTDASEGVGIPNPVAQEIAGMKKDGINIVTKNDLPRTL